MPSREGSIWQMIEGSLTVDPMAACLKCDEVGISRGGLLAAIDLIPWKPSYRLVGLTMARSLSAVAATLAIWKNDGVYVPIAPEHPAASLAAIVESCDLDVIVSDRRLLLPAYRDAGSHVGVDGIVLRFYERVGLDDGRGVLADPRLDDAGLCYIAHTSGSSGMPKGVRISHAALLNRIEAMQQFLQVGPDDRFLYKIPTLFDVHVWELVLPLVSGCLLVVYRETTRFCLLSVAELIGEERITIVGFAPAMLCMLLRNRALIENNALRVVICGGEAWAPELAREVYRRLPGVVLYNSYGPTETTMVVTNWQVPDVPDLREICLGHPHRNTVLVVREIERATTADGLQVTGELLVGGAQVALGYVGGRAADRFVQHDVDGVTMRLYATGDLVRLDVSTGELCFRGRQDNQVKINGVRIELDEVEEALRSIAAVEGCVAFVTQSHGTPQLWAFFTTRDGRVVEIDAIREACARRLSRFRMPSVFRQVAMLPVRENGKIDRNAMIRSASGSGAGGDILSNRPVPEAGFAEMATIHRHHAPACPA